METIDFVITWVDGSDKKWRDKKKQYVSSSVDNDSDGEIRYRDYGLLKYWFRGVEKYASWVHKIFLVTDHQKPDWLNNCEKVVIIDHTDFIPNEYLPTFNSNVIELFMNKIPGLSEHFVYFNDDMYIVANVNKDDFFVNGKPCDCFVYNAVSVRSDNNIIEHTILNNLELLAKDFRKANLNRMGFSKIMNLRYGKSLFRSLLLLPWKGQTGIYNHHMPISYNKSVIDKVWEKYGSSLITTAENKFRTKLDYSHWVFRYYQLFTFCFEPKSYRKTKVYSLQNDNNTFLDNIKKGKYQMVCINDDFEGLDKEKVKTDLVTFFESYLPKKSIFEK